MSSKIIIRQARPEDYPSFRRMEEKAWSGSGVDVISEKIFNTWLKVFPEGLCLAINNGEVCGHIYAQICNFDPYDKDDNRTWNEMTDFGSTSRTHNPEGNCLFAVSVSAVRATAGKILANEFIKLTNCMSKQYYVGICRMPGLKKYALKKNIKKLTKAEVTEYAQIVHDTIKRKRKKKEKLFDPTLSVFLSVKGSKFCRVIENFLHDKESNNWACVIAYKNDNYSLNN